MGLKFFTNQGDNTVLEKFRGIFDNNADIEQFDALIGYLRASGYFAIQPHLAKVPRIRILVGINVDRLMAEYNRKGLLFTGDDAKVRNEVEASLRDDIEHAPYDQSVEAGVQQFIEDVAGGRVEIRAHPTRKLHAKVYVFLPKGFNEHKPGAVITGSSNLTAAGLGKEDQETNYEFNVLLHYYDEVKFAADEFQRLWQESVRILPEQVEEAHKQTYLGVQVTPSELYYKLLIEYFGSAIEYDPNAVSDLPNGFKRLSYQADAVNAGYRLLQQHGGFFLADVVGLGKTVIATLVAKKFFFKNGFPEYRSSTLIVTPPSIEENWQETVELFKLDNCKIVTIGKLSSLRNVERYDLVVIDEVHRFRNDVTAQFEELQRICKTPSEHLLPDGSRASKKVILVSATPLNNRPADLRNLISLFQDLRRSTLSVLNLQAYFAAKEKAFADAKSLPTAQATARVAGIYEDIRIKVLSEITIRRTRSDLVGHELYSADLAAQGIQFPRVNKPEPIMYRLSPIVERLYDQSMAALAGRGAAPLTYARYRALAYLVPEARADVPLADMAATQLAKIMRVGLAKRLDSSFHAFRQSLTRFRDATRVMLTNLKKGVVYISSDVNITKLILEDDEERLLELLAEGDGTKVRQFSSGSFDKGLMADLEADLAALNMLCDAWSRVDEDPKFDAFLDYLKSRLFDRTINHAGNKLVVFSEAKDTTDYLKQRLAEAGYTRVLAVDSSNRKELMPDIRGNFDANAKQQVDNCDIILTTQVLAEGVNLHRSNVIVNYDTPWNSTLLMQRIGRVNRIGTTAPTVHIFNFYPSAQVDNDIELRKRALMKLQAFHSALGEDSQIYSDEEVVETFGMFDHEFDEEERDERLTLLLELRKFRETHPEDFRRIKHLPRRVRVGRKNDKRARTTVAFIRSQRRDGFYRIRAEGLVDEISVVEAAQELRAPPSEMPYRLHSLHHEQVQAAVARFAEEVAANEPEAAAPQTKLGPRDTKAISLLKAIARAPVCSEGDKARLALAEAAITVGTYQALPRRLAQLATRASKDKLSTAAILDGVLDILSDFHLQHGPRHVSTATVAAASAPGILISESFDD
ncbi:phospholipase D-like domain-containing protein [Aquincola tertiaricarbonis]|uniref:Phospholipase D-like domain-containing protein n=1 Tax=Aquincola tertiaricarbonis TaxID=391953 RepID=A0ABY4S9Q1_AQUTE|nr:helicase-related protein [Aquincola tertiaricarbonis]URI07964.1 phospholipase D-like domain-containing protein [Aquincola tertiaricarbonis]